MARVRFSISLPQLDVDGFDAGGFKDYLTRAEELGFDGGWTLEQTIGSEHLIAPTLVPWMYGSQWDAAVTPTQILVIGGASTLMIDACGSALMAVGRARTILTFIGDRQCRAARFIRLGAEHFP